MGEAATHLQFQDLFFSLFVLKIAAGPLLHKTLTGALVCFKVCALILMECV